MTNTVQKLKNIENVVKECLRQIPETRDNNKLLVLKIWGHQNPNLRSDDFTFKQFAVTFLEGSYADPDTLTRASRKLQRQFPELRGEFWSERQGQGEKTRQEITEA